MKYTGNYRTLYKNDTYHKIEMKYKIIKHAFNISVIWSAVIRVPLKLS